MPDDICGATNTDTLAKILKETIADFQNRLLGSKLKVSSKNSLDESPTRYLGLDLLRLISFQAIVVYHAAWVLWSSPLGPPDPLPTAIWQLSSIYARSFAFSGFTIAFLCSFLSGFHQRISEKRAWLPAFLLFGWVVFCFCTSLKEVNEFHLTWDIYPLLAFGFLTGRIFGHAPVKLRVSMLLVCFALLWVPFWELGWGEHLPLWAEEVLVGRCPQDYADWPILPWLFLIWSGVLSGSLARYSVDMHGPTVMRVRRGEPLLWVGIVVVFIHFSGAYYHTSVGNGWSCFTFRQEPKLFWAHFLFWALLMRLSLILGVQRYLTSLAWVRWLSNMAISRRFFVAYLLHFLVMFALIGTLTSDVRAVPLWLADVVVLAVLPFTELSNRTMGKLTSLRKS